MMGIQVAIIDDGVNENYYDKISLENNIQIDDDLEVEYRENYNTYRLSHGTVCAALFCKYSNNVQLSSIKIIDRDGRGNKKKLIKAIEWCIYNSIDIINLSIGTIEKNDKLELKHIIDKAYDNGIIIIAACNNRGLLTYPASFHNVIGVKCDRENDYSVNEFFYEFEPIDGIEITACGKHSLTNYKGVINKIKNQNSFAAPLITALVANILKSNGGISLDKVKEKLWQSSINYNSSLLYYKTYSDLDWVKSALFISNAKISIHTQFIFQVQDVISVNLENLDKAIAKINQYIITRNCIIANIDTIILDLGNKLNCCNLANTFLTKIIEISTYQKKQLVIVNNEIERPDLKQILIRNNMKIFFNSMLKSISLNKQAEELPVILLVCTSKEILENSLKRLSGLFMSDGYNVSLFSNDHMCIYYGYNYIPNEYFIDDTLGRNLSIRIQSKMMLNKSNIGFISIYIRDISNILDINETYVNADIVLIINEQQNYKFQALLGKKYEKVLYLHICRASYPCLDNKCWECEFTNIYNKILSYLT